MTIISDISDIKKHVAVASSLKLPDLLPYVGQAIDQFTYRYVGDLHEFLAEPAGDIPAKAKLDRARGLLQNAISNFTLYIYLPIGSVIFDSSGLSQVDNQNRTPVQWQQVNDIRRGLLTAGHIAMDLLLEHLEKHKEVFPEWTDSDYYTQSRELLVNNTKAFDDAYHIYNSRQTYLALIPSLRQVEDQYISTLICPGLITRLKAGDHTGVEGEVKKYLQKAIVAFTVAKVAHEGLFTISGSGLKLKFDSLPSDRVVTADVVFMQNTVTAQESNGKNYLSMAKKLILSNPDVFNQCDGNTIITNGGDSGSGSGPYNTSGVLSL